MVWNDCYYVPIKCFSSIHIELHLKRNRPDLMRVISITHYKKSSLFFVFSGRLGYTAHNKSTLPVVLPLKFQLYVTVYMQQVLLITSVFRSNRRLLIWCWMEREVTLTAREADDERAFNHGEHFV